MPNSFMITGNMASSTPTSWLRTQTTKAGFFFIMGNLALNGCAVASMHAYQSSLHEFKLAAKQGFFKNGTGLQPRMDTEIFWVVKAARFTHCELIGL